MRKVVLQEGKALTLKEKNDIIYEELKKVIVMQAQREDMAAPSKKGKFGAVVSNKLIEILRGYGLLNEEDVQSITAKDIQEYYVAFMDLINRICETIELTPTKPLFCAYMGISTKVFNNWEICPNVEIRNWIDAINGDLTHSLMESSMHGNAHSNTALAYAATRDYGQEIVRNDIENENSKPRGFEYTPELARESINKIAALIAEATEKHKK